MPTTPHLLIATSHHLAYGMTHIRFVQVLGHSEATTLGSLVCKFQCTCRTVGMWGAALGVSCHQLLAVESSLARDAGCRAAGWLVLPSRARHWMGCPRAAEVTLAMTGGRGLHGDRIHVKGDPRTAQAAFYRDVIDNSMTFHHCGK